VALEAQVLPAVARGEIIDPTVSIEQSQEAADRLRSGDAVGKIVLTAASWQAR
jgi:hypothetical protein